MAYDDIKGDLNEAAGKVQSKAGEAIGDNHMQASGVVRDLAGQAQGLYADLKDGANTIADSAKQLAEEHLGPENTKAIQNAVQTRPLLALILAAVAGFVLASLISK